MLCLLLHLEFTVDLDYGIFRSFVEDSDGHDDTLVHAVAILVLEVPDLPGGVVAAGHRHLLLHELVAGQAGHRGGGPHVQRVLLPGDVQEEMAVQGLQWSLCVDEDFSSLVVLSNFL